MILSRGSDDCRPLHLFVYFFADQVNMNLVKKLNPIIKNRMPIVEIKNIKK